ncbi:MAG: Ig-like domain-containing protein [Myxococcota bacterium]
MTMLRIALGVGLLFFAWSCSEDTEGSSNNSNGTTDTPDMGLTSASDATSTDTGVVSADTAMTQPDEGMVDTTPPPPAYPEPGDWEPNAGPGAPTVTFPEEMLFGNCAYLSGGETDFTQHHNLAVMYDGYLLLPWAPESGSGGFTFFDISDPCNPQVAGAGLSTTMRETHSIGFSSTNGRWAVVNQIASIFEGGIQFWDVSDSTAPEAVADLALEGFLYPDAYARVVLSVFWQAPYVYVAHADLGVIIVDAADPTAPEVVGSYPFEPVLRAGQIHAIGNLLIVTAAEGPRVALLDISDPSAPQPIPGGDFLITDDEGEPVEAYFSNTGNGYTYHARKEAGGGVIIYDIHDPTQPTRIGALRSEGNGGYVFVKDTYAFVGESDFGTVYDIADMDNIVEVGRFNLIGDLDTVTPIGNIAIVSVDDKGEGDRGSSIAPWTPEPDSTPPRVTWIWPADGAERLDVRSRFGLTFNEMIDVKSAWDGSVRLFDADLGPQEGKVEGHISVQENIVNFWPAEPLQPGRRYTLAIPAGGIVDYNGNPIEESFEASFSTL